MTGGVRTASLGGERSELTTNTYTTRGGEPPQESASSRVRAGLEGIYGVVLAERVARAHVASRARSEVGEMVKKWRRTRKMRKKKQRRWR